MDKIDWPDIKFPPINLWIVVPAWFFYANAEERKVFMQNVLS